MQPTDAASNFALWGSTDLVSVLLGLLVGVSLSASQAPPQSHRTGVSTTFPVAVSSWQSEPGRSRPRT